MLKLDGGHKITAIGNSKSGTPFIKVFISSWESEYKNIKEKQWLIAQVYFKQCNITGVDSAFENKEINYAELGTYRIGGIKHWIPQDKPNETTYTLTIYADYVRFYKWDKDKKQEINNDKIEVTQSNNQPKQDIIEEEDIDWDDDLV